MAKHDLTGKHFAHYYLVRILGRGGMSDVYLAEDTRLNRQVALKILPPEFARDEERTRRFDKEIRATASLDHPHITTVYEVGEFDGLHYYTMSLLTGGELKQRIASGMSVPDAIRVLKEMATALSYAHSKGFIHRDIKPENILFHEDGRSCLTDLGIALAAGSGTRMTATGMSIGTPHYMSPEQCQGEHDLDGRSDLYSLGIVFYEMLTGKVPYDANNTVGIVMKHVQAPVPTLPPALAHYQPVLNGLLAKDRNSRFSSATELIKAIEAIQSGAQPSSPKSAQRPPNKTTVIPTPPRPGVAQRQSVLAEQQKTKTSSSHGVVWALGGAALAAVIAIGAWYYYQPKPLVPGGGVTLPVASTTSNTNAAPTRIQPPGRQPTQSSSVTSSPLEQQLAMARSGIRVSPTPSRALVYVDGAYTGSGTLELTDLQGGGSVTIRAEAEGFQTLEQVVRVPTDRMLQLTMDLDKVIPRYAFTIEPDPADAKVRILNIEPVYQKGMLLEPGQYQVEVSKPGYVTVTRWVELAGQAVSASIQLRPANFALTIQTNPSDAMVRLLEPARTYQAGMVLAPGRYRYEVTKSGFKEHQGVIELADHDVVERVELAPGWKSGETFKDCNECPEMVVIPSGSFQMGSPSNETGRSNDEGPQHRVTIGQPFALGKYEVTVGEFTRFISATNYRTDAEKDAGGNNGCVTWNGKAWAWNGSSDWRNPGFSQSDSQPVTCISWNDVEAYTSWLASTTGESYRLPSEAEWEYAARAGTTSAYWWGVSITCSQAAYGFGDCNRKGTESVGSFRANAFGLYDMHGNVWEWTQDCWNGSYSGAPADGAAWTRGDCSRRVLRGGSWDDNPRTLRAAFRYGPAPSVRDDSSGFRLARTL